jgi:mono/diheme cytochrome c family protein
MPEQIETTSTPRRRWIAIAAAVVVPAVLTITFWRTTPTVGGWGQYAAAEDADKAAAVDYSQNGRLPVGAAATDPHAIYLQNCAACHGQNLEGGRIGPALKRPGWPYAKDQDLLVKILHQGRGLTMPGYDGRLNNQQIEALANWLQEQNAKKP